MKKLLLNFYFWPVFVLVTLFGLSVLPFILLAGKLLYSRNISTSLRLSIRLYDWLLVYIVPFMAPTRVKGNLAAIPTPAIFVANHNSAIDPYLFGAIPAENSFVTSWPFKIPIYSPFMKMDGYINTADGWERIKKQCKALLQNGVSITIWPEGHRSRDGKIGRFRKGAFQLSVETGVPIQPVCILGSGAVMFPGKRLLSPGSIELVLLEPVYPDPNKKVKTERINVLRDMVYNSLQQCISENGTSTLSTTRN